MRRLFLAIKYWTQGDAWSDAWYLAGVVTENWGKILPKRHEEFDETIEKYRR